MKLKYGRTFLFILAAVSSAFFLFTLIRGTAEKNDQSSRRQPASQTRQNQNVLAEKFQNLPLYFEPNIGQENEKSSFMARGYGYEMRLLNNKAVMSLAKAKPGHEKNISSDSDLIFSNLTMSLANSDKSAQPVGEEETTGKINYLVGSDQSKWLTDIPTYQKVRYKNVYSGIDLLYYGKQTQLEFDFIVAPEANPQNIKLNFEGAKTIAKNSQGELVISLAEGEVALHAPVLYQTDNHGEKQTVDGEFALVDKNSVKFKVGSYDRARELVIDPVLSYSTFLPGANIGYDVAVDNDGNAVVTGYSSGVPTTTGSTVGGVFVTKFNPQGSNLVFSTRVGGSAGSETGRVIKLDGAGNMVVAGTTSSRDFPAVNAVKARSNLYISSNASESWLNNNNLEDAQIFQTAPSYQDANLVYAAAGNRIYRSMDGGSSWTNVTNNLPNGFFQTVAVNPSNSAQILTASQNGLYRSNDSGNTWSPVSGATQSGSIGAIVFDPNNPQIIYLASGGVRKTIDGGATWTSVNTGFPANISINALAINSLNSAVLYAGTNAQGFYKTINAGANWSASNTGMSANTNIIRKLAIDPNTPTTFYAVAGDSSGSGASYIFKTINEGTTWSLIYTSSGGSNYQISAIAASRINSSRLYIGFLRGGFFRSDDGGATWSRAQNGMWSSNISSIVESPLTAGKIYVGTGQDSTSDDAFVFKLNPNGNSLVFSTTFGGSEYETGSALDVDAEGNAYIGGTTTSYNFPTINAVQPRPGFDGASFTAPDAFVAKIASGGNTIIYSSYLGGNSYDDLYGLAVDGSGSLVITGKTQSPDFPTRNALQPSLRGIDAYLTKLSPSGSSLVFSTFWGTTGEDAGNSVKIDGNSNIIMVGSASAAGLPAVNALQPNNAGGTDGFLSKFSPNGDQVLFSTYFGGNDNDRIQDIDLDPAGNIYVAGTSSSKNFPQVRSVKSRSPYYRTSNRAAKWSNLNTNVYSEIRDFAFHPTDSATMFAVTGSDFIKTTDGGDTWSKVASAPAAVSYTAVEFNPQNASKLYLAYAESGNIQRVAVSSDGGASWNAFNPFSAGSDPIYKIVVAPTNPQIIYAATFFSVYKTTDGGANWQRATTFDIWPIQDFAVNPANPSMIFTARQYSEGGIYRSLDGGATWQRMSNGITGQYAEFVVIDPQQPSTVYARTSGGIFKSTDNGDNWTLMQTSPFGYRLVVDPFSSQTLYLFTSLSVDAPNSGVYRSTDGGTTWTLFNDGMPVSSDFNYMEADPRVPGTLHGSVITSAPSNDDIFVSKFSPTGTDLIYSSVLGGDVHMGSAFQDVAFGVAVNSAGSAFVTGGTSTSDFPTTPGAYNRTLNNTTLFLARFDPAWTVKGKVTDQQTGNVIQGVNLTLNGSRVLTTESDGLGKYVFSNVAENDNFNLVPSKLGYDFTPPNYAVSSLSQDQTLNFTGVYVTHTIEGRITFGQNPLANVTVNLSGSQSGSTVTDSSGNFSFTVPKHGDYTVIPALDGYIFAPQKLTFNNVTGNLRSDFTARAGYAIGGQILRNNNPAAGVTVSLSGSESQATTTDSSGRYSFDAGANGNYLVTPALEGLAFSPVTRSFSNLNSNQTGDFTASRLAYATDYLTFSGENSFAESQNQIFNIDDEGLNQQRIAITSWSETQPAWSPNGRRIAYITWQTGNPLLAVMNYNGTNSRTIVTNLSTSSPDWSPDGSQIAFTGYNSGSNIYIVNSDGSNLHSITNDLNGNYNPKWSPDGTKIVFSRTGKLFTMNPDGTNMQRVTSSSSSLSEDAPDWSPDGNELVFAGSTGSEPRIYLVRADGTNLRRLTNENVREMTPAWSLKGTRIAYMRDGDAGNIYTVNVDGSDPKQITNSNLRKYNPVWRPRLIAAPLPDFDGDGKTDISIYRPVVGEWWINRSSTSQTFAAQFGDSSDNIVSADFTGDGKTDIAIWRGSTGEWFILRSEDSSYYSFPFGAAGDIPVVGDFDGDTKSDVGVFRPSTNEWFILKSSGGTLITTFGGAGDKPVSADYDGDGRTDIAIFRPADGSWWYVRSSDNQSRVYRFGVSTDKPVPGDYTGDGKADIAVFRPSTGEWFVQRSEDNSYYSVPFGQNGDLPVPGDYDGDGRLDTAVFRPEGSTWYIQQTTAGVGIVNFGIAGDRPIPNAFVP